MVNPRGRDTTESLVQLDAECPQCGKRERRRVSAWRLKLYRDLDPDLVAETVQCKCGHQYQVKVSAYQGAA